MADYNSEGEPPRASAIADQYVGQSARIIAETASDAIITIDQDSTILFINNAAAYIFGYSTEEMLGSKLTMLMPEYLRHVHRAGLKQYIETGQRHIPWEAVELPGLHKSGREILLELSFGEFRSEGKRFFTGIARDITKRKRDEQCLTLQHSVTQTLADATSLAEATPKLLATICVTLGWQFGVFWLVDSENNQLRHVANWSDQSAKFAEFEEASRQFGFARNVGLREQVWARKEPIWISDFASSQKFPRSSVAARENLQTALGLPILLGDEILGVVELFSPQIRELDHAILDTLSGLGSQIGQFIERKNAESERVGVLRRAHEARLEAEALARQLGALQKVTDAALAHLSLDELLPETLDRIREVLNVNTVAILLLDTQGNELVAWAALGLEEEVKRGVRIPIGKGFAGKVVAELKPIIIEDVSRADVLNPSLAEKGIKSLLGVPVLVEGRPIGVLHVGTLQLANFTEEDVRLLQLAADRIALPIENARLYQVEQDARTEAQAANRAKDEFLTILSHELRTPLTPIIGWIHMMQYGMVPEADFSQALSVIHRNAYNLKRLINDLLDMSAILSGKMRIERTPVSLPDVLQESVEAVRPYARDSKVHLCLKISDSDDSLVIKGDRNRLNQTFCNVLHNAIKYSPPDGTVEVVCETDGPQIVVSIKDQGEGIPEEFLPYVFDRFRQADASRTRAYGGLGLGLALVKSFVEAHGGSVEAAGAGPGKGSVFCIKLSRETQAFEEPDKPKPKVDQETERVRTRIMIVEDQPDTLEMLATTFQTRSFETLLCQSAIQALEVAGRERFDVLISDIAMPEMDGFQLIKELRQHEGLKNLPAIALTGYASKIDEEAAIAAGFDLHLSKPIDPAELRTAVENLLSAKAE